MPDAYQRLKTVSMPLTTKTSSAEIKVYLDEAVKVVLEDVMEELAIAGEVAVNAARERGSYTDRTGNLRSSTGYILARDGEVHTSSSFAKIIGGFNPKNVPLDGDEQGRTLAEGLAKELSKDGFALIVVAGMEYASYVSDKGYDVLDSAELEARRRLEERLPKVGASIGETVYKTNE